MFHFQKTYHNSTFSKRIYTRLKKWSAISQKEYHSSKGVFGYNPELNDSKTSAQFFDKEKIAARSKESNLNQLINAYRQFGHLKAGVNPLGHDTREIGELDPQLYGLKPGAPHDATGLLATYEGPCNLEGVVDVLNEKYCGNLGFEFMYLPTIEEREWFAEAAENISDFKLPELQQVELAADLLKSQAWDNFLAVKFQSVKRYGGEGAESTIAYFSHTFRHLCNSGAEQVIIGMAHRGRLNLLTGLLKLPPSIMFRKMKGLSEFPEDAVNSGDVLSHLVSSVDLTYDDRKLHVSMFPNPSHLEAVNPVVCGKTRSRQRRLQEGDYDQTHKTTLGEKVVCLQVHGDAALSGQGVIQETLALSQVPHYRTGGSIHMSVNNQVGYTTPGQRTRSTLYCTDIAKMAAMPVIHVNGDEPEAVVQAARLAIDYQRKFHRDVFVDIVCWRKWGHNELDNPRFTNPSMYLNIDARKSVPDLYAQRLVDEGILTEEQVRKMTSDHMDFLNQEFKAADTFIPSAVHLKKHWSGLQQSPFNVEVWDTGVDTQLLKYLGAKSVEIPSEFALHPQLRKSHIDSRMKKITEGSNIDWATAEALAMASLIHEGNNVRISGQDVGRGTFSQRHCMLVDQDSDEIYIPLNHISPTQTAHLEVANSILSEEAVLGFEYGMSVESPNALCIWEAQFGDFYNGAQIMIDTFVSSGEAKWLVQSGLTMVLPTGFDGAGPEHSSCHIERFLQLCDSKEDAPDSESVNWNITYPTTPANYFHLLRRQLIRNYRKPLIIAGPKVLLRLPAAVSTLADMQPGTSFSTVLDDPVAKVDDVQRLVFVSGKHYYTLAAEIKARNVKNTAVVRLESLCPFPCDEVNKILKKYKKAKDFIWAQEEHRNMGAWSFVNPRFENLCGTKLKYIGRDVLGTTAVGVGKVHQKEAQDILDNVFK